MAKVGKLTI